MKIMDKNSEILCERCELWCGEKQPLRL